MYTGLIDLPWWGYIVVTLVLTHITIASVTIFLHRSQAHRGVDLHPIVSHFFRWWLWLTTGQVTKEWVSIHRKHHARCEREGDPHSPVVFGIKKVFWQGAELYREESRNKETMTKFGAGTPDDWIERNVYTKYSWQGVGLMVVIDLLMFGPIGLTIWAVQMLWIPVTAAGIINGIGHWWGYRNFASDDEARNIVPWGIIIGGEELHNNHHAYGTSAKLSNKWYEFDIGWMYIRILEIAGLAKVLRVAPKLRMNTAKLSCDAETLQAVITHRYEVVTKFARELKATAAVELANLKASGKLSTGEWHAVAKAKSWLLRDGNELAETQRQTLQQAMTSSKVLATIFTMRQELAQIWARSTLTKEQLVHQLDDWCKRAEASGIEALQQFSLRLRTYA